MNTAPTHDEVREALMWAIDNDHRALVRHRTAHHLARTDSARLAADEDLVERWPGHRLCSA
ncbi:hypothetical protein [Paraoerskovia marina]|uniref:Uncharacterized protein n=1 Tax=Paraoerskovia marina TaxID=545619 RepID=A0A1H1MKU3_9CELL|nr:hypothetical protein [Paraoerskovia marina]SDR87222.1 hypothetical protein SAMN04489860_0266 [Paraoerskovia marina]